MGALRRDFQIFKTARSTEHITEKVVCNLSLTSTEVINDTTSALEAQQASLKSSA